jgi:hypothetical protein
MQKSLVTNEGELNPDFLTTSSTIYYISIIQAKQTVHTLPHLHTQK